MPLTTTGSSQTPPVRDVKSFADLRALSQDELERRFDGTLSGGTQLWTDFYRDELERRDQARRDQDAARREDRMLAMTRALVWLTTAIGAATIIALAIALAAYLR